MSGILDRFIIYFMSIDNTKINRNILFYVHVTVHRNTFLYNKTNQMHQLPKFTPA